VKIWQLFGTEGSSSLRLASSAAPEPLRRQVRVRVGAVSLNYRDVAIARGTYPVPARPGLIPASDCAGVIEQIGPDVARFQPGDRVTGTFVPGWISGKVPGGAFTRLRGSPCDGVLAEQVIFEEEDLIPTPPFLSDEEAATTPCAGVTAWNALYGGPDPLKPGETVLIQGTGGVAIFALQIAHAAGARIVMTSSNEDKLARARAMGMWQGVNYRTEPEWDEAVTRLTGGEGAHIVVEIGGPGTLARSIAAARFGGTVSLVGVLTRGPVDPLSFMHKGLTLRSIGTGSRDMHEALYHCMSVHQLHPSIDRRYRFEDAPAAFDRIESGAHFGKVVIRID